MMSILSAADVEMLMCEKENCHKFSGFYERIFKLTGDYNKWVNDNDSFWLFSEDFEELLWKEYPWNSGVHHHTDLFNLFNLWLQTAKKYRIEPGKRNDLYLQPDIYRYANTDYPELVLEWLNMLACNVEVDDATTIIFSYQEEWKPQETTLFHNLTGEPQTFALVRNKDEWDEIIIQTNPWKKNQLPQTGDYPYIPDSSYVRGSSHFPRQYYQPRDAVGFKDERGRLWVPDEEGGKRHWDVQCPPFGRDHYFKVTPDGRLLGDKKPC